MPDGRAPDRLLAAPLLGRRPGVHAPGSASPLAGAAV